MSWRLKVWLLRVGLALVNNEIPESCWIESLRISEGRGYSYEAESVVNRLKSGHSISIFRAEEFAG